MNNRKYKWVYNFLIFNCLSIYMFTTLYAAPTNEEVFTNIYDNKAWGTNDDGEAHSGGGSTLRATKLYRVFLQQFLDDKEIHSVVDIGCGDWEFSRKINWKGIKYTGYDVVKSVIKQNQKKYGSSTIKFFHGDAIYMDLPPADLLICKDVLQHLPNEDIQQLVSQLHKYKHCLITNDVNEITLSSQNFDIKRGGYRYIDLTKPPFLLAGKKILTFKSGFPMKQVFHYMSSQE